MLEDITTNEIERGVMSELQKEYNHYSNDCKHTHFMVLHSLKIKVCYDCGHETASRSDVPVHQR